MVKVLLVTVLMAMPLLCNASMTISSLKGATHVEIPNLSAKDYKLNKTKTGFQLVIQSVTPDFFDKIKSYKDKRIKKVSVNKQSDQTGFLVDFYTIDNEVEAFDYLASNPESVMIDFYVDEVKQKKIKEKKRADKRKAEELKKKRIASDHYYEREPASELIKIKPQLNERLFNGETVRALDLINFDINKINFKEDSIVESRGKIFLRYPMLMNQDSELFKVLSQNISYKLGESDDDQSKDVRRLKKVFLAKNYKKFLIAKHRFMSRFPKTKFKKILTYMEADALYKVSMEENSKGFLQRALSVYDYLTIKYPDSPLTERTVLFAAFTRMKNKDHLGAIKNFKYYIEQYPESPLKDQIELHLAQNLVLVKNHQEAIRKFEDLIETGEKGLKKNAYFAIGDVYFDKKDFKKAIRSYNIALEKYPDSKKEFPNALYNKGEAEFVEEKYRDSLLSLRDFLVLHERHPYTSFAYTRMGEIFEVVGERKDYWKSFYNQSSFTSNLKNGGPVAKLNLLAHELSIVQENDIKNIVKQIKEISPYVDLPHSKEFVAFKVADAYFKRGLYKKSTDGLIRYFKNVQTPIGQVKFYRRIGRGISFQIRDWVKEANYAKALSTIESYEDLWYRRSERIDFSWLRAQIYTKLGIKEKAVVQYENFFARLKKLPSQKDVIHFEDLPSLSKIRLDFIDVLLAKGDFEKAKSNLNLVDISKESKDLQQRKIFSKARLISKENKEKSLEMVKDLSPNNWLEYNFKFDTAIALKNYQVADASLSEFVTKQRSFTEKQDYELLKDKLTTRLFTDKKSFINLVSELPGRFTDKKYDFNEFYYKAGLAEANNKKWKSASKFWEQISENSIWKKLADEASANRGWKEKFDKYVNRIPAMAEQEKR